MGYSYKLPDSLLVAVLHVDFYGTYARLCPLLFRKQEIFSFVEW